MHIPDGFLDPKISGGLLGAAAGAMAYCFAKAARVAASLVPSRVLAAAGNALGNVKSAGRLVVTEEGEKLLKKMAEVSAWIFAAQMFNFPVQSGTSGHFLGGVFAALILGPYAGALSLALVLAVQALLFADGGLAALGANIVNMAVIGSFIGYFIYLGLKKIFSENISTAIAAWISVMLAALACSLEIGFSGTIETGTITRAMLSVHAIIGLAEAFITVILVKLFRGMEKK